MSTPTPLAGMRVIELTQFIAGPTAAQLLADFGADVLKIEPASGDGSRQLPGTAFGSAYFRSFNTSKRNLVLDMRSSDGRAQLEALLAEADALVCNMAPAALKRAGLAPEDLQARFPKLVITLISGFGRNDGRSCMDTIAQCESGFAWLNADADGTPRVSTSWPVDFYSGLYAAFSTAMALCDRNRTGGMIIDLTMMDVASAVLLGPAAILASEGAGLTPGTGNRDRASAPSNVYACADGFIYIYGGMDPYWKRLRPVFGGEEADARTRLARAPEFDAMVEAWTRERTRDEVLAVMAELSIPAGAVRQPDEAIAMMRRADPGAVSRQLPSGEHLPAFPACFDGQRILRQPAPKLPDTE